MNFLFISVALIVWSCISFSSAADPVNEMFTGVRLFGALLDEEPCMRLQIPVRLPDGCDEKATVKFVDLRNWGNKMTNNIPCEFEVDKTEADHTGQFVIRTKDPRAGASGHWNGCSFDAATFEFGEWILCEVTRVRHECKDPTMSKTWRESFLVKLPNKDGTFGSKQILTAEVKSTAWKEVTILIQRHDYSSMKDLRMDWKYMNVSCEISHDGVMLDKFWHVFDEQIISNPQDPVETRHSFVSRHTVYDAGKRYLLCYTYELFERDPDPEAWRLHKTRMLQDFQNIENPKKCMIFWI